MKTCFRRHHNQQWHFSKGSLAPTTAGPAAGQGDCFAFHNWGNSSKVNDGTFYQPSLHSLTCPQACQIPRGSRVRAGSNWAFLDYISKPGLKISSEACLSCPRCLVALVQKGQGKARKILLFLKACEGSEMKWNCWGWDLVGSRCGCGLRNQALSHVALPGTVFARLQEDSRVGGY